MDATTSRPIPSSIPSFILLIVAFAAPTLAHAATPIHVPWPCGDRYRITQGHNGGSHTGESRWAWDIGIPVGGEVAAPADGVVSHVRMNSTEHGCSSAYATKANYVVIQLADGTQAQLAHLQAGSSTLRVGDRVRQGDVVGKVGLSGYVCGAHLHFKIQTPCRFFTCPSVQASFVDFGDPGAGTTITSNNCPAPDETELLADVFDRTMSDIDGDGAADVCMRGADGIECMLSEHGSLSVDLRGPELSDAKGWADISNFSTLRLADVTGDGRADLCARANAGIRCWPSVGDGFGAAIVGPDLDDDSNWDLARYYSTLRMPDIDGDGRADLCARAAAGLVCFRSTGDGFEPGVSSGVMSDEDGWALPEYYATLRMGDIDGDGRDDACARDAEGVVCWLSDGERFGAAIRGPRWSDENGWSDPSNYTTIRLGDVDGDGRADICARANAGYRCHLFDGTGFGEPVLGPAWSDDLGWGEPMQYATIALTDVDGDGRADACGRGADGIECWSGVTATAPLLGPAWTTEGGWDAWSSAFTVRFADIDGDGRADVCGRGPGGYECWRSTGTGFEATAPTDRWASINAPAEFATIRLGGIAQPVEPIPPDVVAAPTDAESPSGDHRSTPQAPGQHTPTDSPRVIDARGTCSTAPGRGVSSLWMLVVCLFVGARARVRAARTVPFAD